jgi:hypothetical protein
MRSELSNETPVQSAADPSVSTKPTKTTTISAVPVPERGKVTTVVSATVDSCVFYATRKP